ncbi:nuclear pore protein 84/107 [Piromyces finnis]|uniref:Nuclear pore complex protein n=1 Tax=Piromyces finnis TaxID=1754191 RepID=A0A1Y1VKH6_9FUNG|nr:nuclear pore protein 84/107 [Piromyces finnis]|eukprot:ORX58590.1 nuclear pore protein 84/107 [Piromyces finnis]
MSKELKGTLEEFHDAFVSYKNNVDIITEKYINICQKRIKHLSKNSNSIQFYDSSELLNEKLELNTWKLIQMLNRHCKTDTEPDICYMEDPYISDASFSTQYLQNEELKKVYTVKEWLQDICSQYSIPSVKKDSSFTLGPSSQKLNREQKKLSLEPDTKDQEFDEKISKVIYELIRRGKLEEAIEYCEQCGQPWRGASLRGTLLWADPNYDKEEISDVASGNRNRDLWKSLCFKLANEEKYCSHERAIYSVMSGTVKNALVVCKSWEDYLWVYCNSYLENELSKGFKASARYAVDDNDETDLYLIEDNLIPESTESIFNSLLKNENEKIRKSAAEPFHYIQKMIILNKYKEMIIHFKSQLEESETIIGTPVNTDLLRFFVHFILLLKNSGMSYPEKESEYIIITYINSLIKYKKRTLIAGYASHLTNENQIKSYVSLLKTINEPLHIKKEYIKLAQLFGLDTPSICTVTVNSVLDDIENSFPTEIDSSIYKNISNPITSSDIAKIHTLEWLTFEVSLVKEFFLQSNRLYRYFLGIGKLTAAQELFNFILNINTIQCKLDDNKDDQDIFMSESIAYCGLIDAYNSYVAWKNSLDNKPDDKLAKSLKTLKENEWKSQVIEKTKEAEQLLNTAILLLVNLVKPNEIENQEGLLLLKVINTIIRYPSLFLLIYFIINILCKFHSKESPDAMEGVEYTDQNDLQKRKMIQSIYIPQIFLWLHTIYFETKDIIPENLNKSFDLVNDVASQFCDQFELSNTIEVFLDAIKKSAIYLLDRNPNNVSDISPFIF